jgi:hypothetical protein
MFLFWKGDFALKTFTRGLDAFLAALVVEIAIGFVISLMVDYLHHKQSKSDQSNAKSEASTKSANFSMCDTRARVRTYDSSTRTCANTRFTVFKSKPIT